MPATTCLNKLPGLGMNLSERRTRSGDRERHGRRQVVNPIQPDDIKGAQVNTKSTILAASLLLNVILAVGVLWFATVTRRSMQYAEANYAEEGVALLEDALARLESTEPDHVERTKELLRQSIDVEKRILYMYQTAPR